MRPVRALCAASISLALASCVEDDCTPKVTPAANRKVVVMVWDGLRPDSVNATDTPNLAALKAGGVDFSDNHSTYPTFTMMNGSSFATGSFPGTSGFYGNTYWEKNATGKNASGGAVSFLQPVFTEDWQILADLDAYYATQGDPGLLLVKSLFAQAQAKGLKTAAVGKRGPAALQDLKRGGSIIDEDMVFPQALVQAIQTGGDALPVNTPNAYATGAVSLTGSNGNPTGAAAQQRLVDGATLDASAVITSPWSGPNSYMMGLFIKYVLPGKPDLTLIWFRIPDSAEHSYGPGSSVYRSGLKNQDDLLGQLQQGLAANGIADQTDIIVVSDHGHSSVSGPVSLFPLRAINNVSAGQNTVGDVDNQNGYSVSGDVKLAELINAANLGVTAYDGSGCTYEPVMSGIDATKAQLAPDRIDADGSICGRGANFKYTFAAHFVPSTLPSSGLVISANGGSAYINVLPAGNPDVATVKKVVQFLQSREEIGAIFVAGKHGAIDGTLSLDKVRLEGAGTGKRQPDIVLSYTWDDQQAVQGMPGIEFEDAQNNRGMHGSFSRVDVHNTLLASGPDFRAKFQDVLPSGNVDVAPTVAAILGLQLDAAADGRPLYEALKNGGVSASCYSAQAATIAPAAAATGITMYKPTAYTNGPANADGTKSYQTQVSTKTLKGLNKSWTYFDSAKAVRQ
jgi:arylsulfatase A-like enzyme